jgi:hypothetical protein
MIGEQWRPGPQLRRQQLQTLAVECAVARAPRAFQRVVPPGERLVQRAEDLGQAAGRQRAHPFRHERARGSGGGMLRLFGESRIACLQAGHYRIVARKVI